MKFVMIRNGLLMIALAAFVGGCSGARKANADDAANVPAAAVVKVARGNIADNLEIASEFQPFQEVDVYAKVSGYIHKLKCGFRDARQTRSSPGGFGNSGIAAAASAG